MEEGTVGRGRLHNKELNNFMLHRVVLQRSHQGRDGRGM